MGTPYLEVDSVAGLILDIQDDVYGDTFKSIGHLMPDSIKDQEFDSIEKIGSLRDEDFGAVLFVKDTGEKLRKYALHNPASTWLSGIYFYTNIGKIPPESRSKIASRIQEAFNRFEIEPPEVFKKLGKLQVLGATPQDIKKLASVDTIPTHYIGLPKELSWPLFEKRDVEKAVGLFPEKLSSLSPVQRTVLARSIAYRAGELGLNIGDHTLVSKYASTKLSPYFDSFLEMRNEATSYGAKKEIGQIQKVAGMYKDDLPIKERCLFLDKLAGLVEAFDRENDLQFLWDAKLPDPVYSCITPSWEPSSKEPLDIVKVAENVSVEEQALKNFDWTRLEDKFEKHVVDALKSDPWPIFKSLPKPHQALIIQEVRRMPAVKGAPVSSGQDELLDEPPPPPPQYPTTPSPSPSPIKHHSTKEAPPRTVPTTI